MRGRTFRARLAGAVVGSTVGVALTLSGGSAAAATVSTAATTSLFPEGPRHINCLKVKCVALTFDDGPGTQTKRLLGMLREKQARATFFPVGEMVSARPDALRAIDRAGHEIGNHTWSHASLPLLGEAGITSQVTRTARLIKEVTGERPHLVRPPYGALSTRVTSLLGALDAPIVLWNVDPLDWKYRNSDTVYRNVMRQVRPGSIVLMHDIHPTTVAAVPRILTALKNKGYHFVTVTELYGHELTPGHIYTGRVAAWARAHRD